MEAREVEGHHRPHIYTTTNGRMVDVGYQTQEPLELVPFLAEDAALAAALLPMTREHGLSLGDRACLALGMARGVPVYTADSVWRSVAVDLTIELIR